MRSVADGADEILDEVLQRCHRDCAAVVSVTRANWLLLRRSRESASGSDMVSAHLWQGAHRRAIDDHIRVDRCARGRP